MVRSGPRAGRLQARIPIPPKSRRVGVVYGTELGLEYMGKDRRTRPWSDYKHDISIWFSIHQEYHFKQTAVLVKAICPTYTDTELMWTHSRREADEEESKGRVSSEEQKMLK
ncbi:hypothetical protein AVEN_33522-1 [Araneus ventricosus]|uniref:Uncharacterized protein n=1 Tax=Araneus ventricosus TaxID=182803 RepID=A0A4Y2GQD0_ARAVE|nr:hypothetical protein AVEN_33522-1 [Araneus ventricosus]